MCLVKCPIVSIVVTFDMIGEISEYLVIGNRQKPTSREACHDIIMWMKVNYLVTNRQWFEDYKWSLVSASGIMVLLVKGEGNHLLWGQKYELLIWVWIHCRHWFA